MWSKLLQVSPFSATLRTMLMKYPKTLFSRQKEAFLLYGAAELSWEAHTPHQMIQQKQQTKHPDHPDHLMLSLV
jgi:hypothetical protein